MRIFNRANRIVVTPENERTVFTEELDYYRTNNQYPVILFGKSIINIYKNINVQVIITKACNYRCGFCIENDRITSRIKEVDVSSLLEMVLLQYREQGIFPNISITGGEPTLLPERLKSIIDIAKKYTTKVSVNTNGTNLGILRDSGIGINISRHHYDSDRIKGIFMSSKVPEIEFFPRTTLQCVMMSDGINSVSEMKRYMDYYIGLGARSFSFRGLTTLDEEKQYPDEVRFSKEQAIDFLSICNQVAEDSDFEFIQQKVGDHYFYEFYKYKGCFLRIVYSNFSILREFETAERSNNQWFSRATIIHPYGKVYAGWTYDINEIFTIQGE